MGGDGWGWVGMGECAGMCGRGWVGRWVGGIALIKFTGGFDLFLTVDACLILVDHSQKLTFCNCQQVLGTLRVSILQPLVSILHTCSDHVFGPKCSSILSCVCDIVVDLFSRFSKLLWKFENT